MCIGAKWVPGGEFIEYTKMSENPINVSHKKLFSANIITIDLIHWGRVTHICVGKIIIIGSDNGLSPDRRQAIIWTNAGLLLIGPLGINFSES